MPELNCSPGLKPAIEEAKKLKGDENKKFAFVLIAIVQAILDEVRTPRDNGIQSWTDF